MNRFLTVLFCTALLLIGGGCSDKDGGLDGKYTNNATDTCSVAASEKTHLLTTSMSEYIYNHKIIIVSLADNSFSSSKKYKSAKWTKINELT